MSTLTDRLAYPNVHKVALLEVTAGEWLTFWTLTTDQTYTYEATTSHRVTAVYQDNAALTSRASVALTEANAGSYYWDQANGKVHVHPTGSVSPYTVTLQARVRFDFSTEGRVIDGRWYEGRISSLPTLTMRIEKTFGDPGQIGSGAVTLRNNDGYFDDLSDLQWDAGSAALKLGADAPGASVSIDLSIPDGVYTEEPTDGAVTIEPQDGALAPTGTATVTLAHVECAYADFDTLGTWRISGWSKSDTEFSLVLEEKKGALKKKIPLTFYDRETYPSMDENSVGDPIPVAYGAIYDVRPVCIDVTACEFKVAGHAISSFIAVRVKTSGTGEGSGVWTEVSFATTDEANGEFTLSASDWDYESDVSVDFYGKENTDGTLMENASDVVEDLLVTVLGEAAATVDSTSFAASWNALNLGYDVDDKPVTSRGVSLYLNDEEEATEIIARINACVGSYFFNGFDGKYHFKVFDPPAGDDAAEFDESEVKSFSEAVDATEIFTSVRAGYQYRQEQDYAQVYTYSRTEAQYLQGAASAVLKDLENLPVDRRADAEYVAQRVVKMEGERLRTYKAKLSHKAWDLLPGDFVHIEYSRHGIDDVFEVLEVRRNLKDTMWVDVLLGDLHGFGDGLLFICDATSSFPSSLGSGDASAWDDDWTDAQKAWARQNVGYITEDSGHASSTDPDSFMAGIIV